MPDFLTGRVIVVTGAGGRLAGHILHALALEGAKSVAIERPGKPAVAGAGTTYFADVSDERAVEQVFAEIHSAHGRIDGLVHTAGGWDGRPLAETSLAQWDAQLVANLTTAFLCFREAIRHMGDGGGRLVAIASAQGADSGVAEQAAYSAAKAGVVRLVEAVAAEYKPRGLYAFALAPSTILYDGAPGPGVPADDLSHLCIDLFRPEARSMSGSVVRAYGM
ncbi:MAG: SDR family oxidoreductase [Rhodothermales bacterium]|nr:SDR family oxidoreductase [Rhodothermales bacterium]